MAGYRRSLVPGRWKSRLRSTVGKSLVTGTCDGVMKPRGPETRGKSGPEVSGVDEEHEVVAFWSLVNECLNRWHVILVCSNVLLEGAFVGLLARSPCLQMSHAGSEVRWRHGEHILPNEAWPHFSITKCMSQMCEFAVAGLQNLFT